MDPRVEQLQKEITDLAAEVVDKADMPVDRVQQIEDEITVKSAALDEIIRENQHRKVQSQLDELDSRFKAFARTGARDKAAAILAGAGVADVSTKAVGPYNEVNFLSALVGRRRGDTDAQEFVKAVLGTSDATGQAIVPNNFVSRLVEQIALVNPYRRLFNVTNGVTGAGVDIPYEVDAITAALVQGAYGSNKDVRDFGFTQATATLYTIAQIADIGNQLLRQSNGAAENAARRRLAGSIGIREAQWINNGSGSSQPLGILQAFMSYGDVAAFKTALNSESRAAAIGRGIGALEARGVMAENLVTIMHPTDFWKLATETLGSSGSGGWVYDPATGAAGNPPITSTWGVQIVRDPNWPAAYAGTAVIIDRTAPDIFTGDEYRIDVSSEAGNRFDQNITGFRAEEEFAFNALPVIATGRAQKVTGI